MNQKADSRRPTSSPSPPPSADWELLRSLLRELEQMYASDEQAGKPADELQVRLKGNLEYARSIFESRVALEGGEAAALLDDEIGALLDTAQDTPFARHLATVSGRAVSPRNAAEAS
jgi:hypothetical protein